MDTCDLNFLLLSYTGLSVFLSLSTRLTRNGNNTEVIRPSRIGDFFTYGFRIVTDGIQKTTTTVNFVSE